MMRATINAFLLLGLIGAGLSLATGCASEGKRATEATKAVESLKTMRAGVVKAKDQLNATIEAMNKLGGPGNLKSNYRTFSKALSDTESQAKRAGARAEEMRQRSREYISQWEKEMSHVSSPELRAAADERRQRVRNNFDTISAEARDVRQAYEPVIKDLRDINMALSLDLTPAGVQAAKPAMDKANADARILNQQLDEFIAELDRVSSGMSPGTK